jgi:hypothetical protein
MQSHQGPHHTVNPDTKLNELLAHLQLRPQPLHIEAFQMHAGHTPDLEPRQVCESSRVAGIGFISSDL